MSHPPLGSYDPADVTFLLKPVALAPTDIAEKERRIQSGAAHYSEMISEERRPDERYMAIFHEALDRHETRIAQEVAGLAKAVAARAAHGAVTLCSLVRAGVPYGVLLHRELQALGIDSAHFGVSIIRDKGLDAAAMAHVEAARPGVPVIFVDGWTGKGAIAGELHRAWRALRGEPPVLAVLADPCGHADLSAGHEDWLIPSGILGANISGLISRSILNPRLTGPGEFHGAIPVDHLRDIDLSRAFVDRISALCDRLRARTPAALPDGGRAARRAAAAACVAALAARHAVETPNRIKPGIAEATRAVLRRRPRKVYLAADGDPDLAALVHLCQTGGVETEVSPAATGPYRAITLIERVS